MLNKFLHLSVGISATLCVVLANPEAQQHPNAGPVAPAPVGAPAHAKPEAAPMMGPVAAQPAAVNPNMAPAVTTMAVKVCTTADLKKHMAEKKVDLIFDARGVASYEKEHVKGSINVPYDLPAEEIVKVVAKAAPGRALKDLHVVTYCQNPSCPASSMLAKKLVEMGFTHVHELPAGIEGWIKDGGEIESSAPMVNPAHQQMGTPMMSVPAPAATVNPPVAPAPANQAPAPAPQPGTPVAPAAH